MKECTVCSRCFPDQVNHCPGDGELLKQTIMGDTVLDGRYQLEKRLGQGGMGIVFKARHIFLKTQHAIKIILPDLVGNDPSLATRFRQEALAAAAIQHPNTVSVTDYGIISGTTPFLVMEFIEGRSLHDILLVEGKLAPARALEIILAVCAGVAAAHREDIVHRDLKPLNILLKNNLPPAGGVKVLDFGLAKIKSGELLGSLVAAQTQGMMGSPYYMAPEQWSDDEIDRRADIYSLGVILYQMLAGEVPFKGTSVPSIMNKHMTTAAMPLSERGIAVPPELERAVHHALAKKVGERPQTVEEFIAELQEAYAAVNATASADGGDIGMRTVQIPPSDTLSAPPDRETAPNVQPDDGAFPLQTVVGVKADTQTAATEEESQAPAVSPSIAAAGGTMPPTESPTDGSPPRGAETAHQKVEGTAYHPGALDEEALKTSHGEAPTEMLDTAGEVRLRADLAREREVDEERARAEQEAAAARLREEEERQRHEAEEEEEKRRRREESEKAAAVAAGVGGAVASQEPAVRDGAGAFVPAPPRPRPPTPLLIAGAVALVVMLGLATVAAYFVVPKIIAAVTGGNTNTNANANVNGDTNTNVNANANTGASPQPELFKPDLVSLPGGTYRMGRAEVPPVSGQYAQAYLLWLYSQWPAHEVKVGKFDIDRTEVTNAEYAAFVRAEGHPAPPAWGGDRPKAGEESLPVSGVSYEDTQKFAAWRSRRDSATYRLPTEEEWEYAARGGVDLVLAYPWGQEWSAERANLNTGGPKPVGSHPSGRTPQGAEDMIGNVWEWTSSTAAMYKGNDRTRLVASDSGKIIVRGGSYQSTHDGDEPITVTSRRWVARDLRDPVLGFRLVRVAP